MGKPSDVDTNQETIKQYEREVLGKLSRDNDQGISPTSHKDLEDFFKEASRYDVFKIALQNLIVYGFVSRIGTEEYKITENGITELQERIRLL